MDIRGKLLNITFDEEGNPILTFVIPKWFFPLIQDFKGKEVNIEIKSFKQKRSLDANAYAWALIDKLAEKTGISKYDIYREYIKNIGGVSTTICVQERFAERIAKDWERNGKGWQAEIVDSKIKGCKNIVCYEGSSEFDSSQMHRLIELIVQDCKEQGIETETPDEIARRIERWKNR